MLSFQDEEIRKELEEKKEELRKCYLSARKDKGQRKAKEDWDETAADGSNV